MNHNINNQIAVVGIGCFYPGAETPLKLWENVLARRQQFREMPDCRLPNEEYYDPDPLALDKTYQNKASVLDGYEFDWLGKRIPKKAYESTDIVHWLALDTALSAIEDAGYKKGSIPNDRTGVIIGNTLTGEFTRSNQMALRWPYVKKVLRASLQHKGLDVHFDDLEEIMQQYYKSVFAPVTEDTLAGGLANTIAGRVCNFLDLHGGGYLVDGACSSSLVAICTAANHLLTKQMDMVIAGGVDVSLDTFELIGFAKTGALTQDEMRVYDKKGKGFLPGEGSGAVVLKRLEDAIRDNDQVYAIINGWGVSSDGKGGITAPSAVGQSMALKRAYEMAGFDTEKMDFIEGHGTGTAVGDKTELSGISIALNSNKELKPKSCGMTSFKSIVGHTKAAAGVGAFIKTVIAVNRRVLPPTAGCKDPNPVFDDTAKVLFPLINGQKREQGSILHAGVSAMGFGGINSHVLLQSPPTLPNKKFETSLSEEKLMVSNQSSEVFFFAASDLQSLISEVEAFQIKAKGISYAEMTDLAFELNRSIDLHKQYRASIVASVPSELQRRLEVLRTNLLDSTVQGIKAIEQNKIVYGKKKANLRIGALYPGQGSQKLGMGYKLVQRFDWAKEFVNKALQCFSKEDANGIKEAVYKFSYMAPDEEVLSQWKNELKQTNIAQPAIVLTAALWQKYLENLGIDIVTATGHSLGELMSFYAAGFYDEETLLRFAAFRGRVMANCGSGTMASLFCNKDKVAEYIKQAPGYVTIANLNTPEQTVISGEHDSVSFVVDLAKADQVTAFEIPVSAAFHSALIADTAVAIKKYPVLSKEASKKKDFCLVSSVTGSKIEDVDLHSYFATQAMDQVNFIDAVKAIQKECDLLIEIGPGKVLTTLTNNISESLPVFPVEALVNDDDSFSIMLANVFVHGSDINISEIYRDRLVRDFTLASEKQFLVNPLERPFPEELLDSNEGVISSSSHSSASFSLVEDLNIPYVNLAEYLNERGEFIKDVILSDIKYLKAHQPKKHQVSQFQENLQSKAAPSIKVQNIQTQKIQVPVGVSYKNSKAEANELIKTDEISSVKDSLYSLVCEKTGFPVSEIKPGFKLLDDLNLDSIKAGSLLSELSKKYQLQGKFDPSAYANSSLEEIESLISEWVVPETYDLSKETVDQQQGQANEDQKKDLTSKVLELVEEKTGFPKSEINLEFKLLDDLNLDSIKAGSLLSEIVKEYGLQGKVEPSKYANASIQEIITAISPLINGNELIPQEEDTSKEKQQKPQREMLAPIKSVEGVKSYTVDLIEEPLQISSSNPLRENFLSPINVGILCIDSNQVDVASALGRTYQNVRVLDHRQLALETQLDRIIVLMPFIDNDIEGVNETVEMLSNVAFHTFGKNIEIAFVQFGDGSFSKLKGSQYESSSIASAVGFASSMHLERPDAKLRVVELDKKILPEEAVAIIHEELATNERFYVVGIEATGKRQKMFYEIVERKEKERNNFSLSAEDVVLVTGGGKGITAECAIALAEKYKCKMALVGSSQISDEIRRTLNQYATKGLNAQYFACDITDRSATDNLLEQVSKALGPVSAVVHGAGINKPRRVEQVSVNKAIKEISPKLIGAVNLIQSLSNSPLKAFFALTSIIGVTGMQGNSWYAFSNDSLDIVIRNLKKQRNIHTGTFAYSVWSEVGMGARMGSTHTLANMGIGSIPPKEGVKEFLRWIEHETDDQQIVIAAGLGGLDTWQPKTQKLPRVNRYIEEIEVFEKGVELVAYSELSKQDDKYVSDHNFNGSLLFPTVFGIEAMTQAALLLTETDNLQSIRLENITLLKPIVVPEKGNIKIQIKARVIDSIDETKISVGISIEDSGFSSPHFSADIVLNPIAAGNTKKDFDIPSEPLAIDPGTDLYTWLLFQGPMFQNIDKVYSLDDRRVVFSTKLFSSDTSEICLSEDKLAPFVIGSPILRDVLLQAAQLLFTKNIYLPIRIKKWEINNVKRTSASNYVECKKINENSDSGFLDVLNFDENGNLLEQITQYEIKSLSPTNTYPTPTQIADKTFLESKIKDILPQNKNHHFILFKNTESFSSLNKSERHNIENRILAEYIQNHSPFGLQEKENMITWNNDGKPQISNSDLNISISHSRSFLLMSMGENVQSCDIEFVEHRENDDWLSLLGHQYQSTLNKLPEEDLDIAATRIWCVKEVAIKAYGHLPELVSVSLIEEDTVVFYVEIGDHHFEVVTKSILIWPKNSVVVAFIQHLHTDEIQIETPILHNKEANLNTEAKYDISFGKFTHKFSTTFKDCKAFFGKTYFVNFPLWMGHLRELVLEPVSGKLINDFRGGKYGMVTNTSDIKIYNEAETLDEILGTISITDKSDFDRSYIDLSFEWFNNRNGELIKLADCNLSTTWVSIEGHGIVKESPLPGYFLEFLNKYKQSKEQKNKSLIYSMVESYPSIVDLGQVVYESSARPRPEIMIQENHFQTGIHDGNSVGNLYYSNYYDWQAKCIEKFIFKIAPEIFLEQGKQGEYLCVESKVNHLQEAMPFEEIKVKMYIEKIYENGMTLFFEYFSLGNGTNGSVERKLAYGSNTIVWAKRDNENSTPQATQLNQPLRIHLNEITGNKVLN